MQNNNIDKIKKYNLPRASRRVAVGVGALIAAVVLSGCGLSRNTTATTQPAPSQSTTTSENFNIPLTTIGATIQMWDAHHTKDPSNPTGYWPRFSSGLDTYTNVYVSNGIVSSFYYNFYPVVELGVARETAKGLLPGGTKLESSVGLSDMFVYKNTKVSVNYLEIPGGLISGFMMKLA